VVVQSHFGDREITKAAPRRPGDPQNKVPQITESQREEAVFGGNTQTIVGTAEMAVFLNH
jgi:hypothetical protein